MASFNLVIAEALAFGKQVMGFVMWYVRSVACCKISIENVKW